MKNNLTVRSLKDFSKQFANLGELAEAMCNDRSLQSEFLEIISHETKLPRECLKVSRDRKVLVSFKLFCSSACSITFFIDTWCAVASNSERTGKWYNKNTRVEVTLRKAIKFMLMLARDTLEAKRNEAVLTFRALEAINSNTNNSTVFAFRI